MLEKQALKKFINAFGKDEMLHWGYKDGKHYLSNGYVVISGTEAVLDTEIVGLLYKYFGIIPESSDTVYRNKKEMDTYTHYEGTHKVIDYMRMLEVKDEYPELTFSQVYMAPKKSAEMALYLDTFNKRCVCISRSYHDLIDWDIFAGVIVGRNIGNSHETGIIFTHFETGTVMLVQHIRVGDKKLSPIISKSFAFAGDTDA